MRLLISLHDVTPFHFARLLKAEALFQEMGLQKLTYLFIPNYHGRFASAGHPEFVAWCRRPRSFDVEWQLHGDHHLEAAASAKGRPGSWRRPGCSIRGCLPCLRKWVSGARKIVIASSNCTKAEVCAAR